MNQIWALIIAHQTTSVLVIYWLFSNVVSALPSPQSYTSFYRFFFNLMHGLAGSIGRISPSLRIPGASVSDIPGGGTTTENNPVSQSPVNGGK